MLREHERRVEAELASSRASVERHAPQVAEMNNALTAMQKEHFDAVATAVAGVEAVKKLEASLESERFQCECWRFLSTDFIC